MEYEVRYTGTIRVELSSDDVEDLVREEAERQLANVDDLEIEDIEEV